jgi:hypothetical protein
MPSASLPTRSHPHQVQETERLQADAAAWARLTPEQQAEKLRDMKKYQGELKVLLYC